MQAADPLLDQLLLAVGRGERAAFRRLYDCTSRYLMAILLRRAGRREIAEELLQDCYVAIWQRARTFDPARGRALTWLCVLVRNRAVDYLRARKPDEDCADWAEELDGCAGESMDPSYHAELSDHLQRLSRGLLKLSPEMRTSVLLAHYAGHSHMASARLMGAPLGTVKSWIRRGVEGLRTELSSREASMV